MFYKEVYAATTVFLRALYLSPLVQDWIPLKRSCWYFAFQAGLCRIQASGSFLERSTIFKDLQWKSRWLKISRLTAFLSSIRLKHFRVSYGSAVQSVLGLVAKLIVKKSEWLFWQIASESMVCGACPHPLRERGALGVKLWHLPNSQHYTQRRWHHTACSLRYSQLL